MSNVVARTALLLALAGPGVQAQQVQVLSDGKPVALADAGNAARARIPDERKGRRPLAELADAANLAKAYTGAKVRCGLDEQRYPPEQPASAEEVAYLVAHSSYLPLAGSKEWLMIDEYRRGKAVLVPEPVAVRTPQCPAGVSAMYWSASGARVLFATRPVTGMKFHGGGRLLWTATFGNAQEIWQYRSGQPFHKLLSLPNERVVDMFVPDEGDTVWLLSQAEKLDLRNPRTWLRAATGTPARKMDIILRHVDSKGAILATIPVASGVPTGLAHFIRE